MLPDMRAPQSRRSNTARLLSVLFVTLPSAVGCVAPVQHNTPSGRPEVNIGGVTRATVQSYLTNEMLNHGYNLTSETESRLVFDRPMDNPMAGAVFGSEYDSIPNARITYTIAERGGAIRIVSDIRAITNPGSAFERQTDL